MRPNPREAGCAVLAEVLGLRRGEQIAPHGKRAQLLRRVCASARDARRMFTVRGGDGVVEHASDAPGVRWRLLYAATTASLRAGEPTRVRLIELDPGARWSPFHRSSPRQACEWLVLKGRIELEDPCLGHLELSPLDHLRQPLAVTHMRSTNGARAYLRESPTAASARTACQREAAHLWHAFAPGIARRLVWSEDGEASMLYRAAPGAAVPGHRHLRDEECLMLEGDAFVGDLLLRQGDYQLAPAGTAHDAVSTDVGGLLWAHGDLDLAVSGPT